MQINFKQGNVSLHKILPEGSTRFIVADTEEEIANDYLSMIRISNEAIDDEGDEWRRCKECGQWKPLDQMTGAVYLSYPGQYDCKECVENLFNKKPEDFCHRHLVADWITKYGVFLYTYIVGNVVEFGSEKSIVLSDEVIQKLKDLGYK